MALATETLTAWAIAVLGIVDLTTVYPHPRGAMVNWLVSRFDLRITNLTQDEQIRRTFMIHAKGQDATLVRLNVEVAEVVNPETVEMV